MAQPSWGHFDLGTGYHGDVWLAWTCCSTAVTAIPLTAAPGPPPTRCDQKLARMNSPAPLSMITKTFIPFSG
jgi:hypothetical protein